MKKKAGRPPKVVRRRTRTIGGHRVKLSAPKIMGYVTRWANDDGIRIHDLTENDDWDFVFKEEITREDRVSVGDPDISNVVKPGEKVSVPVGTKDGKALFAYLLKKKREYFDADFKEKQAELDKVEEQLYNPDIDSKAGTLKIKRQNR